MTFRRAISPTERMYFPMRDMAPPFLMQLVIPGDGTIDAEQLQQAVKIAAQACPGARLVRRGKEWIDSGIAPTVRVVAGHTLEYPELEADPVLTSPIGPSPDSTVEVLLLTGAPTTLVFRVFHGAMDGMGMVLFATSVLRVLRGEEPTDLPDPIADAELVRRIGAPGRPAAMVPTYRTALGHGHQEPHAARHLLRRRTIHATGSGAVARVAALLAAQTSGTSRIMMPVDLRRHDPELRSTANLALPLFLDIEPGAPWTAVKEQIKSGLTERRELNQMAATKLTMVPDAANRALLRSLNRMGADHGRNLASATVSHMGRFTRDELAVPGFEPTTIYALPQHSVAMPLLFGLMEFDGRTELTVSARNGVGLEGRLEALLDRIVQTLEQDFSENQ
ncbi:peptide synthetase [Nocardia sp. XZ_19_385]|uniref:peptide synthetase n=1 Tax=Nocardia sp. XZ_19_385 TaxID=2769488 RepID=UPI00188E5F78|nr:peptide synthetase [Nocardia sp. XZ_19_385]